MRKLINGASIMLIFIIIYGLLTTVFDAHPVKSTPEAAVAPSATPSPNVLLVSTTPTPDPTPESTPAPTLVSTPTPVPLQSRVVKHQPDQFRKGGISKEELSAIKKAIEAIPWSRNSNPIAAADEDYAAIVKECNKSSAHDLLADLITEAASNDYQPNNEAANGAYFTELNSDYENGHQSEKSTDEINGGKVTGADSGLAPGMSQPDVQKKATSLSPAQQPASAAAIRPKIRHVRLQSNVRHGIVDVKKRLIALWHHSLAQTEKSSTCTLFSDSNKVLPKKGATPTNGRPKE